MDDLNKKALEIGKALASSPGALAAFQSIKPVLPNALIDRAASVELTQAMNEDAMLELTKALETVDPNMLSSFMKSMEEQVMQDVERMGGKLVELGFPDPRQDHDNWRIIAKMVGANPDGFMEDTFVSAIAFHAMRELEKSQAKKAVASTSVMIIREAARAADLAHVKRMKEQNDAEEQSPVRDEAAKETAQTLDEFGLAYDKAVKLNLGAQRSTLALAIYNGMAPKRKKELVKECRSKDAAIKKLVKDIDNLRMKRKKDSQ